MSNQSKIRINLDAIKSNRQFKRLTVKPGSNLVRVLPPFGEVSNGYPYRKWQIIWLTDANGKREPVPSSMMAEKRCPFTEYVAKLKLLAEVRTAELKAQGLPADELRDALKPYNDVIGALRPKTVYVYNAADKSGEVGLLELKPTAHKKMKTEMSNYVNDYNQDPTSLLSSDDDSGVWFNVIRTGEGFDTEYDVQRNQLKTKLPTGKLSIEDDRSPLPASVTERYEELAYDLSSLYQPKSYEELATILRNTVETQLVQILPEAADLLDQVAVVEEEVQATPAPTKGKAAVTTRFDDQDDEAEVEAVAPVAPARRPATSNLAAMATTTVTKPTGADEDSFSARVRAALED